MAEASHPWLSGHGGACRTSGMVEVKEAVCPTGPPADTAIAPRDEVGNTAITPRPPRGEASIPTVETRGRAVGYAPLQRFRAFPAKLVRNASWRDAARPVATTAGARSRIAITGTPGRAECGATRLRTDRIGVMADPEVPAPVMNMGKRRYFPERIPLPGGRSITA